MAKRDSGFGNARWGEDEEVFLRQCVSVMGISNSDLVRKCVALSLPTLMGNPFARRVEFQDTMQGMRESVNYLWNKRFTKG